MHETLGPRGGEPDATDSYQAVNPWSVASLVLGFLSVLALLHELLWVVPLLGVAASLWALRQISTYWPTYIGRTVALTGLGLSLLFAVAASTSWWIQRQMFAREAEVFALRWFDLLRHDDPLRAHQLTLAPRLRRPFDATLPDVYREEAPLRAELEAFVEQPAVRALLALGEGALVRLYETKQVHIGRTTDMATQVFAVTFEEAGERQSFFVDTLSQRTALPGMDAVHWQISSRRSRFAPLGSAVRPSTMPRWTSQTPRIANEPRCE